MGIPTNIKTLLSGQVVEWARIEFKETWDAEASLKTICAFANDIDNWGGGYLIIGVRDKQGQPDSMPGVPPEKIDAYQKDMLNKCKRIHPEYMPITEVADYLGKKFLIVWAPGGSIRPYSSPKTMAKDCRERIYWIRKMASTIMPTEVQKKDLYELANNVPFDDRVNHQASLEDLNLTLIQQYLREVDSGLYHEAGQKDFVRLCRDMNLISELPEYAKPRNAALMFFSLEPEKFFPYAQIDVVQFPDGLGGDQIIEKIFRGPIHQQLRESLQNGSKNPQTQQRQTDTSIIRLLRSRKLFPTQCTIKAMMYANQSKSVFYRIGSKSSVIREQTGRSVSKISKTTMQQAAVIEIGELASF